MKAKRKRHESEFKARVALEAIKGILIEYPTEEGSFDNERQTVPL
jgi:hypothetical protein